MSKKRNKHYDESVYRSFAMLTQFGIYMLVPICIMLALGIYLDEKLGTSFLVIFFFCVGAVAGGQNVYRLAKRIYSEPVKQGDRFHENNGNRMESELFCEDSGNIKKEK